MSQISGNTQLDDIISFTAKELGISAILNGQSALFNDLGCAGDDLDEFLYKYSETFQVDMSDYLWYFHNVDESLSNLGAAFFSPVYEKVKHIPITLNMLAEFANSKKWTVKYPGHEAPKKRLDIRINQMIAGIVLLICISGVAVYFFV